MNLCKLADILSFDWLHKWKYGECKRECLRCGRKQIQAASGFGVGWVDVRRFANTVEEMYREE